MSYFSPFPLTTYGFVNTPFLTQVVNILKRVKVRDSVITSSAFYWLYQVQDGERPDVLAAKVYGDPNLYWILLLTNKVLNPFFDWPLSVNLLNDFAQNKYGSALYDTYGYQLSSPNPVRNGLWMPSPSTIESLPVTFQEKLYDAGSETINPVTFYEYETMLNDAKRQIRLFRTELVPELVKEFLALVTQGT